MCGICASVGKENQVFAVVDGLKKLEYRGYDSSGIATLKNGEIEVIKSVGGISNLEKKLQEIGNEKIHKKERVLTKNLGKELGKKSEILNCEKSGKNSENLNCEKGEKKPNLNIVIGHTRWATHGVVSEENAHPHISANGQFAMVHNGIIENFEELKKRLNVTLNSQTDTEVFVNLIASKNGDTLTKIRTACKEVKGSFAVAILDKNSDQIFLAKRSSPLYVAVGKDVCMAASDICVFAGKFKFCFIMSDDEFACMNGKNVEFFDKNGKKIEKEHIFIENFDDFDEKLVSKTFMEMEINSQVEVLKKTYQQSGFIFEKLDFDRLKEFENFHFIACGTAYHSSCLGAKFVEKFCHKSCEVSIASEFRYGQKVLSKNCLYVFVSQSGETADTIACAELVKAAGQSVMCVTNVPYCSLNNLADFILPTFAGREVAVASTKAYTAQVFTLLLFALKLAEFSNKNVENFSEKFAPKKGKKVQAFDKKIELKNFLSNFVITKKNDKLFKEVLRFKKVFFIGREQDYVTALEAALKLKEIAYINCLGIAAGELKHGTLALVDEDTLVIAIFTQSELKEKMESNILEVKARGAKVMLLSQFKQEIAVDFFVNLDDFDECLMPIVSIVPLQQLALFVCLSLGFNPDKPRNLAKSVTVE